MVFSCSFASVVDLALLLGGAGLGGFGLGGGNGRTMARRIDLRSVGFGFAASLGAGLPPVFRSDFGGAFVLVEAVFLSVVGFFVTASSVLR
jgi:hypothetical protein